MCEMSRVHALNFRALCGANLVTLPWKFRGNETFEVKGVDAVSWDILDQVLWVL